MTPRPRFSTRLLLGHGGLALICLALAGALLFVQRWYEQDRRALLDAALPRFSDMLEVSRLGDTLAETAGALATAVDTAQRRAALETADRARADLEARLAALNGSQLEAATRDRLRAAVADVGETLETLDALVARRLQMRQATADLNARLGMLGDLLPDLEQALLAGRAPEAVAGVLETQDLTFPPGPSGTKAANAIRGWARHAQVTVGMMLAASGAGGGPDLDYLAARAEESLRRAASAIRAGDRGAMPVMEAVQAELVALSEGVDGADSVFRVRRQRLTMAQNLPAVLERAHQASDRLSAAVTQIIADLEQARAVRAADRALLAPMWTVGIGGVALLGIGLALWSGLVLWRGGLHRLRRLTEAVRAARDDAPVNVPDHDLLGDEIGVLAQAVGALDAERRRLAEAVREYADRQAAVLDMVPAPILVLSADGRVENANPAAVDLFGRSVTQLVGRPLGELVTEADSDALAEATAHALAKPGTRSAPLDGMLARPDGEGSRTVTVTVTAPSEAAAATPCLLAMVRAGTVGQCDGADANREDVSHAS
ncbi:PAS domain-containing protein [uncultured Rhodospira sp.]|uniref:PAS domain-containing protein n=1 Tax=uncultured Rhodospira sp. TaxID=1936189 RepID=UPI00261D1591|nr:PAS domain-containing protein [uncultured Rhodospira sp.]